jgi:hypothetical protein
MQKKFCFLWMSGYQGLCGHNANLKYPMLLESQVAAQVPRSYLFFYLKLNHIAAARH